ncbi:MAG: class I SAM-dependent methyltransferase [Candidatus Paceibacterota bacterium]
MEIKIFYSKDWSFDPAHGKTDYELVDTGEGEKLERFGQYTFVRPFEDAVWPKTLPKKDWEKANGKFWSSKQGAKAGWTFSNKITEKWEMSYQGVKFLASPTPFRHLGFFPEQASHWDFIESKLRAEEKKRKEPIKFLNLFGYTGVASLFALRTGAEVTHVDASASSLKWAKENQEFTGMENLPMRIIEDDVIKFLEREEKRGNKYDAVIMDPPKFGRGPKGEVWKIEEMLPKLLMQVRKVLSDKPIFVILTSYAIDSSALSLGYALSSAMQDCEGSVEAGELCVLEKSNGRMIPLANTAVWEAK